jgi:hypothetical protein
LLKGRWQGGAGVRMNRHGNQAVATVLILSVSADTAELRR